MLLDGDSASCIDIIAWPSRAEFSHLHSHYYISLFMLI